MVDMLPPVTLLRVAPAPLLNLTLLPFPMEKLCQSTIPRPDDWVIVVVPPDVAMPPVPATKWPPEGRLPAATAPDEIREIPAHPKSNRQRMLRCLPNPVLRRSLICGLYMNQTVTPRC